VLLLDVDEHTGAFGGARAFFEASGAPHVDGVMIGYPGLEHVVTGGRGVLRARLHVHGVAGHSGSASSVTPSAIAKAAGLVTRLHEAELPGPAGPGFPLPARLTVTAISGGGGYSVVPDLCMVNVDVRLTLSSTPGRLSRRSGRPLPRHKLVVVDFCLRLRCAPGCDRAQFSHARLRRGDGRGLVPVSGGSAAGSGRG
jgi:acetylornithine deacetylase/succinyl-diaminopimelate desuccinylase-like protein